MAGPTTTEKPKAPANGIVTAYLVLYNIAAMCGWAYFIAVVARHFMNGGSADTLWASSSNVLKLVQTSALLEILHASFGLVRSNAFTVFVQVMSRVVVLWGISDISPPSQTSFFYTLMCISWASVEVPRYLFYVLGELGVEPPYWLLWLRYSLFIVLYPTGITGEVGSLVTALPYVREHGVWWDVKQPNTHNFTYSHYVVLLLLGLLYIPGSPFMIGHMWSQRKARLGKAKAA